MRIKLHGGHYANTVITVPDYAHEVYMTVAPDCALYDVSRIGKIEHQRYEIRAVTDGRIAWFDGFIDRVASEVLSG